MQHRYEETRLNEILEDLVAIRKADLDDEDDDRVDTDDTPDRDQED